MEKPHPENAETTSNSLELPEHFASDEDYLRWEIQRITLLLDGVAELVEEEEDSSQSWANLAHVNAEIRHHIRSLRAGAEELLSFEEIVQGFGLSALEEEVLLVAIAQSLSEPVRQRMLVAMGFRYERATVGFVSELLSPSGLSHQSELRWARPGSALVRYGLIQIGALRSEEHIGPLLAEPLQAPHYVVEAALGRPVVDRPLEHAASLQVPELRLHDVVLSEKTQSKVNAFVAAFQDEDRVPVLDGENWTLLISGPRGSGKTMLAGVLASAFGCPLFTLDIDRICRAQNASELIARAGQNAAFFRAVLHIVQPDIVTRESAVFGQLLQVIERYPGLVILEPRRIDALDGDFELVVSHTLPLDRPDADERLMLWELELPQELPISEDLRLGDLGSAYELNGGQISRAMRWAKRRARAGRAPVLSQESLKEGATNQLFSRIGRYADRRVVRATLEDLILPDEKMSEVKQLLHACKHRHHVMNDWGFGARLSYGKGMVTLFSGEPGTGKTLCAEILAQEMGMELDIVAIPKIMSKWVGETERNIQQIFAEARAADTVLLFDEADSLFGKRVKVERAQDRFQNMEVNMLLQEVERFEGIVILTSNLEVNMDSAFQRRIIYRIDFPMPEAAQRAAIWKRLLPAKAPLSGDVDFQSLGEHYKLSGGQIKNAVVTAAYESYPNPISFEALNQAAMIQAKAAGMLATRRHSGEMLRRD